LVLQPACFLKARRQLLPRLPPPIPRNTPREVRKCSSFCPLNARSSPPMYSSEEVCPGSDGFLLLRMFSQISVPPPPWNEPPARRSHTKRILPRGSVLFLVYMYYVVRKGSLNPPLSPQRSQSPLHNTADFWRRPLDLPLRFFFLVGPEVLLSYLRGIFPSEFLPTFCIPFFTNAGLPVLTLKAPPSPRLQVTFRTRAYSDDCIHPGSVPLPFSDPLPR